jgi:hypothetical protein
MLRQVFCVTPPTEPSMMQRLLIALAVAALLAVALTRGPGAARAQSPTAPAAGENYAAWPLLKSTFPSTGGGGFTIKGYDPIITSGKCITTFMAVAPGDNPQVFANVIEFEATPAQGGILCANGKWRAFEGGATGTTPYRLFFKDGVFRSTP